MKVEFDVDLVEFGSFDCEWFVFLSVMFL